MTNGEIVGMFIGRVCLSLMEITSTLMVCLQARKEAMRKEAIMENKESISSGEEVNNMQSNLRRNNAELHIECKCALGLKLIPLPKLRRDRVLRNIDETQSHQDSKNL
jgi:hypothetical protein